MMRQGRRMLTLVLTVAGACTSVSAGGGAPMGVSLAGGRGIAHRGIQGGGCVAATERGVWGIGAKGSLGERGMDEDGLNMMRLRGGKAVSRSMSKYSMMGIPMSISNKFGMSVVERKSVSDIKEKLAAELKDVAKRNPELFSEERILRFLRSYEHDVEKTVEKMREMLAWRQKHDTDVIRALVTKHYNEDFWQMPCIPRRDFFRKMYLMEPNYKVTKEGDLVSVEYTGAIDIRAFMTQATEHEIIRFWCFLMEWNMIKLSTLSKRYGKIVRMVQVKDLYGQNLWQCTCKVGMERFVKLNKMLHLVYPETLNRLVVANVPGVFGVIYNIFKPILPQRTLSKISILSEGDESMHGFAVLLGADNELAKTGRAEVLFQEVLAGRIERRKRRSKLFKVVVGSALAFLALSKATFIDDESISQAAEPVKKHIALL